MVAFLGSFLQYLIEMIILVLIAFLGIKLGIAWRKHDNAKKAAEEAASADSTSVESADKAE